MDRNLGAVTVSIAETARTLLTPSAKFEPFVPDLGRDPIRALGMLSQLEFITRASLQAAAPAIAPAQAPAPVSAPPSVMSSPGQIFHSSKKEYRAALQDSSVVEALLSLRKHATQAAARLSPATPKPQEAPATEPKQITAPVKTTSYRFKRSPGIYNPILRPTGEYT